MRVTGLSEFAIYGLLFLAIVGFNLFKQIVSAQRDKARRQKRPSQDKQAATRQRQAPRASEPPAEPATREPQLAEQHWGRAPEPAPAHAPTAAYEPVQPMEVVLAKQMVDQRLDNDNDNTTAAQPPGRPVASIRARSGRQLIRHRGELRHAIVLMAVLGPCRALQPYDQDNH